MTSTNPHHIEPIVVTVMDGHWAGSFWSDSLSIFFIVISSHKKVHLPTACTTLPLVPLGGEVEGPPTPSMRTLALEGDGDPDGEAVRAFWEDWV